MVAGRPTTLWVRGWSDRTVALQASLPSTERPAGLEGGSRPGPSLKARRLLRSWMVGDPPSP